MCPEGEPTTMSTNWMPFHDPPAEMSAAEARSFLAEHGEGQCTLLDVRQPAEYAQAHLPGGLLVPLPELLDRIAELDPERPILVYCRSGHRSQAAAQMLMGQGFDEVYNLRGGILAWDGERAAGPFDFGMRHISGRESPAEMLLLAYAMEEGLRAFYEQLSSEGGEPEVVQLFDELAAVEDRHKQMVFARYRQHDPQVASTEELETRALPPLVEGGMTSEELLAANRHLLTSFEAVLDLAMHIEVQALDLYLRAAQSSEEAATRRVLRQLALEERAHLTLLGGLLERR
jgi:rhodanese-related sulfurtransferase/rubrerythrin